MGISVAHPQSGYSSTVSRSNWNLEMLVFDLWREETGVPGEKSSEQGRELTTNSTQIWHQLWESNPGHNDGRRVFSPLRHPCSPLMPTK